MEEDTQEIVETVEEVLEAPVETVPVEELPVEELPVEVIADPGFWTSLWDGYLLGLDWIFPAIMVIGSYIVLRHLIWNSLRFNYRHYLECGEFVLCGRITLFQQVLKLIDVLNRMTVERR